MLHLAAFAAAYLGFALLALGQARHAEAVVAAPPRPRRMLAISLLALSLVLAIQREGWGFGILTWTTLVIIAALAVVATLTWRPGWLRPLASPILPRKAEPMPRRFFLAMPLLLAPFAALAQASGGGVAVLPHDLSPWGMVANADWVVKSVIAGLVLASVLTWTIALAKGVALLAANRRTQAGLAALHAAKSLDEAGRQLGPACGPCAALVRAAQEEVTLSAGAMNKDGVKERAASRLERLVAGAGRSMGHGTGVLATIGATAPFVGLFGTVWGIMNSFIGISRAQTTNLAVVAPGIAEALLATAVGLVAAIPAVVIYNVFARAIGGHKASLADAAGATMRLLSRDLDRGQQGRLRAVGE